MKPDNIKPGQRYISTVGLFRSSLLSLAIMFGLRAFGVNWRYTIQFVCLVMIFEVIRKSKVEPG